MIDKRFLEYLYEWYHIIFKCRVEHRTVPRDFKCYIFANYNDKIEYCKKHNIKCDKDNNRDYFLLNEQNIGCLIGQRINEVILVSSNVEEIVQRICSEAIEKGYNLKFKKELV